VDCGASRTFVSTDVANRLGPGALSRRKFDPLRVKMPDGGFMYTNESAHIPVTMGTWKGYVKAWILPLPEFEFILGRDFLRSQNPQIDWITSVMTLRGKGRAQSHRIEPTTSSAGKTDHLELNLMSTKQVRRALKKASTESCLMVIRESKDESEGVSVPQHADPRITKILQKFKRIWRDELPAKLPPERAISHEIQTGDATPVNLNSYPMSDEKLKEQMAQVEMLLKKGLIRPSASPWGFPVLFVKKPNRK